MKPELTLDAFYNYRLGGTEDSLSRHINTYTKAIDNAYKETAEENRKKASQKMSALLQWPLDDTEDANNAQEELSRMIEMTDEDIRKKAMEKVTKIVEETNNELLNNFGIRQEQKPKKDWTKDLLVDHIEVVKDERNFKDDEILDVGFADTRMEFLDNVRIRFDKPPERPKGPPPKRYIPPLRKDYSPPREPEKEAKKPKKYHRKDDKHFPE